MCFWKSKESKVLTAKRDIIVYKLGYVANSNIFYPVYNIAYCYYKNKIAKEDIYFDNNILREGFHSYITCIVEVHNRPDYLFVEITSPNKYLDNVLLLNKNNAFLGKFIIPKGSTYCMNITNEVISNSIVYTGIYTRLSDDTIINTKYLWKDKQAKYLPMKVKLIR